MTFIEYFFLAIGTVIVGYGVLNVVLGFLRKPNQKYAIIWVDKYYPNDCYFAALIVANSVARVLPETDFSPSSRLYDHLNIDYLDMVELVLLLEEELGQKINDYEAVRWDSVSDVIAFVDSMIDN